jgi:hypothetical protein
VNWFDSFKIRAEKTLDIVSFILNILLLSLLDYLFYGRGSMCSRNREYLGEIKFSWQIYPFFSWKHISIFAFGCKVLLNSITYVFTEPTKSKQRHWGTVICTCTYDSTVTDSIEGMCVDPGEMGNTLQAGVARGPGPPEGEKGRQLASDSGEG